MNCIIGRGESRAGVFWATTEPASRRIAKSSFRILFVVLSGYCGKSARGAAFRAMEFIGGCLLFGIGFVLLAAAASDIFLFTRDKHDAKRQDIKS